MRTIGSKKRFALIATTVAAVFVGGGVAVAYWTTGGTGNGQAQTGTSADVTIVKTNAIVGLYPGGPAQDIDLDITNTTATEQYIGTVEVTVTGTSDPGCTAADFDTDNAVINDEIAGGNGTVSSFAGSLTGAKLQMIDTGIEQDDCKNADVYLEFNVL